MQLTIDTQKDSQDAIRKAIRLLMSLIGEKEVYTNEAPKGDSVFGSESNQSSGAFVDLFNSSPDKKDSSEQQPESKEDDGSSIQFY